MNVTCPHCQAKLNLPDDKVPKDRDSSFKCPKCRESVQIKASKSASDESAQGPKTVGSHGAEVLICMDNAQARTKVIPAVQRCGWTAEVSNTVEQALEKMEYQIFPLVVMDDVFDAQGKMAVYLNELDMSLRRRLCIVLIRKDAETGDHMAAMHTSSNFVVNTMDAQQGDTAYFSGILTNARMDHENFYRVYNDSMKAAGKA